MGKAFAFADVGYFVRSQRLATMVHRLFQSSVSWVTDSELGEKHRSGETMRPMLLTATSYTLVIAWPGLVFLGIEARTIIELLFGQAWVGAAPILQALCVAQMLLMIAGQANSVYIATGDVKLKLRNEVLVQSIGLALLLLGLTHSVLAVAWLRVGFGLAHMAVHMSALRKYAGVDYPALLRTLAAPAAIAALFGAALLVLRLVLPDALNASPLSVFPKAAVMAVVFLGLLLAFRFPVIREVQGLLRGRRRAG